MELRWDAGGLSWGWLGATLAFVGPRSVHVGPSWLRMAPPRAPRARPHPFLAPRGAPGTSGHKGGGLPEVPRNGLGVYM